MSDAPSLRTEDLAECPCCHTGRPAVFFRVGDRSTWTTGPFTYRRCPVCGSVYQDPRVVPEDRILAYKAGEFYSHQRDPDTRGDRPPASSPVREYLRGCIMGAARGERQPVLAACLGKLLVASRSVRHRAFYGITHDELIPFPGVPLRALDVGCGSGCLMTALEKVGWQVEGVEWDPLAAQVARASTSRPVWVGDLRQLSLSQNHFGLIVLHHVLEHVDDPKGVVRQAAKLLAPKGRLVLIYPNPDSLGAQLFGEAWCHWDPPRHLVLPTHRAVVAMALRAGLKVQRWRTGLNRGAMGAAGFAVSRRLSQGGTTRDDAPLSWKDHLLETWSRFLVFLGYPVGEEICITLTKAEA